MELEHSFTIPVPPQQAWPALLDVERIAPCMPGATVDSVDGDVIKGHIKVKVGPVSLTYTGTARFTERDEQARSITLDASGKETRGSGTASATVRSTLQDEGDGTRVVVHTTLSVTGRPAQFGRGVLAEVSGRIIERFAGNLAALLAAEGSPEAGPASAASSGADTATDTATANGASMNGSAAGSDAGPAAAGPAVPTGAGGAMPLEELWLPVRAYNSLRRVGIHTVDDLSARTEDDLLAVENLGPQSVKEIKQRLADVGRHLATQAKDDSSGTHGSAAGVSAAQADATEAGTGGPDPAAAHAEDGATAGRGAGEFEQPTDMAAPPRGTRPPDEDAIDLLSVAGFPVLKRALPLAGALLAGLLVVLGLRRKRRRAR